MNNEEYEHPIRKYHRLTWEAREENVTREFRKPTAEQIERCRIRKRCEASIEEKTLREELKEVWE
jgi:hypothetical protein